MFQTLHRLPLSAVLKSTAGQLHNPQTFRPKLPFHPQIIMHTTTKAGEDQPVHSVGSELQRGRDQERTMESIFAKDAVETPEPVTAAVSGEFMGLSIHL